ncbi:Haus8 [Columba livia]|nr:Haus8 [Columba livia]
MAAEAAGGMSALANDSGATVARGEASENKRKGGRVVKSRYLDYDKKDAKKDNSASSFSTSVVKPSSGTKPRSALPQKSKKPADVASHSSSQSSFEKGDLQSTLLDEDKISRPDLDISAISGSHDPQLLVSSIRARKGAQVFLTGTQNDFEVIFAFGEPDDTKLFFSVLKGNDCDSLMEELESQTLLLTYLRIKAEKNLAMLEKKAEENLIMLCEEKERQQEKLCELKREILLKEREQKLDEALDKQMEVLSPLVPVCEQFKEQYKSFAVSLDATRHELPIKNIHIEGDMLTYLGNDWMNFMLGSFKQVQNLSFEVSKEVSLHNQRICEEKHGLDVVKRWYFD